MCRPHPWRKRERCPLIRRDGGRRGERGAGGCGSQGRGPGLGRPSWSCMPRLGDRERAGQAPKRMSKSVAAKDEDPDRVPGDDSVCPDGGAEREPDRPPNG